MRRRFERRVYVTLPTIEAREKMFAIHTKGVPLDADVDFKGLAEITGGYTAADIALLCREALMQPIRELDAEGALADKTIQVRAPKANDFHGAMMQIRPSVAPNELERYDNWRDKFGG